MTRLDGHDGSRYQWATAPPNLLVMRQAGVFWLAWKATQSTSFVDPTMDATRKMADEAGFTHRLLYHWLSSITNPVAQAEHFLNTVGSFGLWGGMLDAEEKGITEAGCLAWCETVEEHLLRPTSIYTGLYVAGGTIWRSDALRQSKYGPRPLHVAAYVAEANLLARMVALGFTPNYPWHAWQFSSDGPVPGITGRADMNRIDDRAMYDRVCGVTGTTIPTTPPTDPTRGAAEPMYVEDADTGKFWAVFFDGYANRVACPLDEMPDPDWNEYAAVQGAVGPLPKVPHAALQLLYDKRGRPQTPPLVVPIGDHDHDLPGMPTKTGGVRV